MERDSHWELFWIVVLALLLLLWYEYDLFAEPPTVIIAPNGAVTTVYPGPTPQSPVVVLPPSGQPTFIYPGTPAVVIPPSGQPSFVYPGTALSLIIEGVNP